MSAVERLDEIEARLMFINNGQTDTDDVPSLLAALRAVLALTQHNSTISGHPEWIVTAVPVGELLAAIDAALDVTA